MRCSKLALYLVVASAWTLARPATAQPTQGAAPLLSVNGRDLGAELAARLPTP
jgi:hypothetical protein